MNNTNKMVGKKMEKLNETLIEILENYGYKNAVNRNNPIEIREACKNVYTEELIDAWLL